MKAWVVILLIILQIVLGGCSSSFKDASNDNNILRSEKYKDRKPNLKRLHAGFVKSDIAGLKRLSEGLYMRLYKNFNALYYVEEVNCEGHFLEETGEQCWLSRELPDRFLLEPADREPREIARFSARFSEPLRTHLLEFLEDKGFLELKIISKKECVKITLSQEYLENLLQCMKDKEFKDRLFGHEIIFRITNKDFETYFNEHRYKSYFRFPLFKIRDYKYLKTSHYDWIKTLPYCKGRVSLRMEIVFENTMPFAREFVNEFSQGHAHICIQTALETNLGSLSGTPLDPRTYPAAYVGPLVLGQLVFY